MGPEAGHPWLLRDGWSTIEEVLLFLLLLLSVLPLLMPLQLLPWDIIMGLHLLAAMDGWM